MLRNVKKIDKYKYFLLNWDAVLSINYKFLRL
jgi:hypothetical protein